MSDDRNRGATGRVGRLSVAETERQLVRQALGELESADAAFGLSLTCDGVLRQMHLAEARRHWQLAARFLGELTR